MRLSPPVEVLVDHLRDMIKSREGGMMRPRMIVTISGIPGSGKTTLAQNIASILNSSTTPEEKHYKTVVVSMDGYHLPRSRLDAEGLRRRGAPFTFDAEAVVAFVERLKMSTYRQLPDIQAPSFDHAVKDPVEDDITIPRSANIILLEGNYLLLKDEPWAKIRQLVDESWLLECNDLVAADRLAKRHLEAGLVDSLEAGFDRANFNDIPNGRYLLANTLQPTLRIAQQ